MTEITVGIEGLSPMLMNPMSEKTLDELLTGNRARVDKDRLPEDIAKDRIYRDNEGKMAIPMINLIGALKHAGRAVKHGKKAISTATTTTLFSFLEFPDEFIYFDGADENGEISWRPDKRRGVMKNGASQVAVCIVRPRFDQWGFTIKVNLDESLSKPETVKALFVEAGRNAGLCDFRPSKNGPFGRFKVVKFEAVTNGNGKK